MAKILTSAGKFQMECWTDGSPVWVKIFVDGKELERLYLVTDDLHDLIFAAQRMIQKTEGRPG